MTTRAAAPPLSERVCEVVCYAFALWTLCAHAVVAGGGSLLGLIALYAATGAAVVVVRRTRAPDPAPGAPVQAQPEPPARELAWLALALSGAVLTWVIDHPIATWLLLLLVLGAAGVVFLALEPPRREAPQRSRRAERGLLGLAFGCTLYTLVVHRPDADDAFYVNLAVAAVDLPELPLLARDTLHGRFDLPIHYPAYRLQSWELWNGAIARLSGIPAVYVFHWISAALAAALVPLCHAVLFRRLTPRSWPWTTLALVVVLAAAGETHRWYGNFAFVRMWQGKALFLFVFTPLIYAFALRFAERGDVGSWLRLAAAQVAALGCSANAIWAAPVGALMAMACALPPTREGLRRLGTGALGSAYVVVAGLLIKSDMAANIPALAEVHEPGALLADALRTVLGDARLHTVGVSTLFLAFACCSGLARRFAITLPLAVTLVFFDPWTDAWVRANVTGPSFWRAMWALPLPILLALVASAPLARSRAPDRRAAQAACLALLAAFSLLVPRFAGMSERNDVTRIGWPDLKLGPAARWATTLNGLAPRARVVAPQAVNTWIPVFHDHAYPMAVRAYLNPLRQRIGEIAYRDRALMVRFADGDLTHPRTAAIFERGLDLYDVRAVGVVKSPHIATAREILRRSGFVKRVQGTAIEVWAR